MDCWERQPKESLRAYEAFCRYRDLGASRSYREVARQLRKSATLISRWGRVWHWQARIAAYEAWLDAQARQAALTARQEMLQQHARIAVTMLAKALHGLQRVDPADLKPYEIARWIEVATNLERPAREELAAATIRARETDVIDLSLHDPLVRQLLLDAMDRLIAPHAAGTVESSGSGVVPQPRPLDLSAASQSAESRVAGDGLRADPSAGGGDATAPRQK